MYFGVCGHLCMDVFEHQRSTLGDLSTQWQMLHVCFEWLRETKTKPPNRWSCNNINLPSHLIKLNYFTRPQEQTACVWVLVRVRSLARDCGVWNMIMSNINKTTWSMLGDILKEGQTVTVVVPQLKMSFKKKLYQLSYSKTYHATL